MLGGFQELGRIVNQISACVLREFHVYRQTGEGNEAKMRWPFAESGCEQCRVNPHLYVIFSVDRKTNLRLRRARYGARFVIENRYPGTVPRYPVDEPTDGPIVILNPHLE